ncbi:MAG TPA: S41 family peptidase [Micromonosporaceae bacterium]|jgi:hypothetical protein
MGLYLGPDRSGLPWLLDPASPALAAAARDIAAREPDTRCDATAVAQDLDALPALMRTQHFGVATGIVGFDEAQHAIEAARDRVRAEHPSTWGEAIGDLTDELRLALRDRHFRIVGGGPSRIRADEPTADVDQSASAAEVEVRHGVLCVTVRRLWGNADDDRVLWDWARASAEHFAYDRIVVDLRGNSGGNDAITLEWLLPSLAAGVDIPGTSSTWYVNGTSIGFWNSSALVEAADGLAAVPIYHREHRHTPSPDDVLELRTETDDEVEAGERPWHGRMLVYVDGNTRSSGESSSWLLRHGLGARVIGQPTAGMLEYGNIVPYVLPASGFCVHLPTKRNDFGIPMELVGFPVHTELDPRTPVDDIARDFDRIYSGSSAISP